MAEQYDVIVIGAGSTGENVAGRIQRRAHREPIRSSLFNLLEDPRELDDRLADYPVRGALLALLIEGKLRSREHALTTEEAVLDQELEESLRALGYLQ